MDCIFTLISQQGLPYIADERFNKICKWAIVGMAAYGILQHPQTKQMLQSTLQAGKQLAATLLEEDEIVPQYLYLQILQNTVDSAGEY